MCDEKFGFKDGEHDPHKLLLTGFMYCDFAKNETAHMDNLWHLINPNFKATVSLNAIREAIADLLYIAIDQRLNMLDEDDEGLSKMRQYLEQCEQGKQQFLDHVCETLQDGDRGTD